MSTQRDRPTAPGRALPATRFPAACLRPREQDPRNRAPNPLLRAEKHETKASWRARRKKGENNKRQRKCRSRHGKTRSARYIYTHRGGLVFASWRSHGYAAVAAAASASVCVSVQSASHSNPSGPPRERRAPDAETNAALSLPLRRHLLRRWLFRSAEFLLFFLAFVAEEFYFAAADMPCALSLHTAASQCLLARYLACLVSSRNASLLFFFSSLCFCIFPRSSSYSGHVYGSSASFCYVSPSLQTNRSFGFSRGAAV